MLVKATKQIASFIDVLPQLHKLGIQQASIFSACANDSAYTFNASFSDSLQSHSSTLCNKYSSDSISVYYAYLASYYYAYYIKGGYGNYPFPSLAPVNQEAVNALHVN